MAAVDAMHRSVGVGVHRGLVGLQVIIITGVHRPQPPGLAMIVAKDGLGAFQASVFTASTEAMVGRDDQSSAVWSCLDLDGMHGASRIPAPV